MRLIKFILLFLLSSIYNAQSFEKDSINTIVEQQIQTIELKANKKLVERKIDRLVFNVENSVSATGGDAIDALKVTPGIKVQNDKVSIIGKGNILVLINDRPTHLSGDDLISYLKALKSDEIKKIEVITNPSSKYTAEGNSGVLNIIKKIQKKTLGTAPFVPYISKLVVQLEVLAVISIYRKTNLLFLPQ